MERPSDNREGYSLTLGGQKVQTRYGRLFLNEAEEILNHGLTGRVEAILSVVDPMLSALASEIKDGIKNHEEITIQIDSTSPNFEMYLTKRQISQIGKGKKLI